MKILENNAIRFVLIGVVLMAFIPIIQRVTYYRLIIPVIPALSIIFAIGYFSIKNEKLKVLVVISFVLFSFFSIASTVFAGLAFANVASQHNALFNEISYLDGNSLILINSNMQRQVGLFLDKPVFGFVENEERFNTNNPDEFYKFIKEMGITHLATVCYKDTINGEVVKNLKEKEKLMLLWKDNCGAIFKVT